MSIQYDMKKARFTLPNMTSYIGYLYLSHMIAVWGHIFIILDTWNLVPILKWTSHREFLYIAPASFEQFKYVSLPNHCHYSMKKTWIYVLLLSWESCRHLIHCDFLASLGFYDFDSHIVNPRYGHRWRVSHRKQYTFSEANILGSAH